MKPLTTWLREIRPHQWAKNLLVFLPGIAHHLVWDRQNLLKAVEGFFALSLLASAVYVLNDLADRDHDRQHVSKRNRPIAAGLIGTGTAVVTVVVLVIASAFIALRLPRNFQLILLVYLVLTTAYSFALKRRILLDMICLASLYTIRVVAGSVLLDVPLSQWFLAFSIFFFFSLAVVKRVAELKPLMTSDVVSGRGYGNADLPMLISLGTGASMASALVYCLYITSSDVTLIYRRPDLLWIGLPLFLYWTTRIWLLVSRNRMHEDPVVFALRDRMSYLIAAAFVMTLWLAT